MADQPQETPSQNHTPTPPAVTTAGHQPNAVVIQQSSGKGVALGALVLSLLALGASGLLFVQGQNTIKSVESNVGHKIDQAKVGELDALQSMKRVEQEQTDLDKQLQALTQDNLRLNQQLQQVDQAYQQLVKSRHQWLVDEIEFSLNVATQQLLLTGNKEAAIKSLRSIESRLNQFNRPELLPIKQAISADLIALGQGSNNINITSTAVMLGSLENRVDGLKTLLEGTLTAPQDNTQAKSEQLSWLQSVWFDVKNSFRGLVEVRKLDNKDAMLIAPEQSAFLRENIRLHLVSARIALMQQQSDLYLSELQAVNKAINSYYDLEDALTKEWLADLAKVQQVQLSGNSADSLKNSLIAVQQFQQQNPHDNTLLQAPVTEQPKAASQVETVTQSPEAASQTTSPTDAPKAASAPQGGQA